MWAPFTAPNTRPTRLYRPAGFLQGDDGVFEGGGFSVADDGVDLGPVDLHGLPKGGEVVVVLDLVEGRDPELGIPDRQERVLMTGDPDGGAEGAGASAHAERGRPRGIAQVFWPSRGTCA